MSANPAYDEHWKNHKSGPPATDPRASHHAGYRHHPTFDLLCDDAARRKLTVRLGVSTMLVISEKGSERRELRDVRLFAGDDVVMAEPIRGNDVDGAARRLMAELH